MTVLENIQTLCKQRDISIPRLEKELGFGNGAIYKWDKNSPSIDKLQKVADYFGVTVDSLLTDLDQEIFKAIRILTMYDKTPSYFPLPIIEIMQRESENLRREYYDVPFDFNPQDMRLLLKETDLSTEFKKDFLKMLNRVIMEILKKDWGIKALSPEEQKVKNSYIQHLRANIELNKNIKPELTEIEFNLVSRFRNLPPVSQQTVLNLINNLEEINKTQKEQSATGEVS